MQVQRIQNDNNNTGFKASVVDSKSLRVFKAGLKGKEIDIFDSCLKTINESKDKSTYIFDVIKYCKQGSNKVIRKVATISKLNNDRTIQHPPVFSAQLKNALSLFQELAEKCAAKNK